MQDTLRIAGVIRESIVDGPGLRYTIFTQGCPHRCRGCHNPQTHDPCGGKAVSIDRIAASVFQNPLLAGVTFSGGEPFLQPEPLYYLSLRLHEKGLNIFCYTGYRYEELLEMAKADVFIGKLLEQIDVLVDGRFIEKERDLTLKFRGSRNQRLINVPSSLRRKTVVNLTM